MMKLKIIMIMLLAIGIVACTKGDEADYKGEIASTAADIADIIKVNTGEFEGVWIVDKQEIDTARLIVNDSTFKFTLPEDYLVGVANDFFFTLDPLVYSPGNNPDTKLSSQFDYAYTPSGTQKDYQFIKKGSSDSMFYFDYEMQPIALNQVCLFFKEKYKELFGNTPEVNDSIIVDFRFQSSSPCVAMLDKSTYLWTLQITLDKISVIWYGEEHVTTIDPVILVFIAKKKIN